MSGLVRPGEGSPFDAIRRTDESGEYWMARELMPLLGYDKWERFEDAIDRAMTSANLAGGIEGFSRTREEHPGGGRPRANYRLSRFAAYLTAMNGDVRKQDIADAQAYFAVKTREAETAGPTRVAIPTARELAQLVIAAEDRADAEAARREVAEQRNAELEPKAAAADALMEAEGTISMGALANQYDIGRQKLFDLLRAERILQSDRRPYQDYADWFRVVTKWYEDSDGIRHSYVNTRIYTTGAIRLYVLLTKRGRELRKPVFDTQLALLPGGAA